MVSQFTTLFGEHFLERICFRMFTSRLDPPNHMIQYECLQFIPCIKQIPKDTQFLRSKHPRFWRKGAQPSKTGHLWWRNHWLWSTTIFWQSQIWNLFDYFVTLGAVFWSGQFAETLDSAWFSQSSEFDGPFKANQLLSVVDCNTPGLLREIPSLVLQLPPVYGTNPVPTQVALLPRLFNASDPRPAWRFWMGCTTRTDILNWGWVKTLVPSEPQNSCKWMFIPLKMYLIIGIDPYPTHWSRIGWPESRFVSIKMEFSPLKNSQYTTRRWLSFKDRKPLGELTSCDAWMAERTHWWTKRRLRLWVSLSLFLFVFVRPYLSPCLYLLYLSVCLSCLSVCLSVFLSINPFIHPSIHLNMCIYIYISLCLYVSVCLSICLYIYLTIYLDLSLSTSLYISLYHYLHLLLYLSLSASPYPFIYLSVYLSVCPSIHLSI